MLALVGSTEEKWEEKENEVEEMKLVAYMSSVSQKSVSAGKV